MRTAACLVRRLNVLKTNGKDADSSKDVIIEQFVKGLSRANTIAASLTEALQPKEQKRGTHYYTVPRLID